MPTLPSAVEIWGCLRMEISGSGLQQTDKSNVEIVRTLLLVLLLNTFDVVLFGCFSAHLCGFVESCSLVQKKLASNFSMPLLYTVVRPHSHPFGLYHHTTMSSMYVTKMCMKRNKLSELLLSMTIQVNLKVSLGFKINTSDAARYISCYISFNIKLCSAR